MFDAYYAQTRIHNLGGVFSFSKTESKKYNIGVSKTKSDALQLLSPWGFFSMQLGIRQQES